MMKWVIGILAFAGLIAGTTWLIQSDEKTVTANSHAVAAQGKADQSNRAGQQDESAQDEVDTVAGKISVVAQEKNGERSEVLKLGERIVYDQNDWSVSVSKAFHLSDRTALLISIGDGGNACDGSSRFVSIRKDGSVAVTDEFAVCEGTPIVSQDGEAIIAIVKDSDSGGEMQWRFADGALQQTKTIAKEVAKNAPVLQFEPGVPFKLRGTLVSTSSGKDWALKLSNAVRTCEACDSTIDSFPIDERIKVPDVKGETDFEVTMESPRSGDFISKISIATRAEPINLEGVWLCIMRSEDGSNYHDSFTFYGNGIYTIKGLEGNARGVELSGTYQVSNNLAVLTQRTLSKDGVKSPVAPKQANLLARKVGNQESIFEINQNGSVTSRTCKLQSAAGRNTGVSSDSSTTGKRTSSLCEINPAACESVSRNNDIRQQILNDRCTILENQLAGVPGGEYQLRKAGCR